ncbi:hypothetical protein [Micromonospora sp. NPDC049679]|uniref:hypothetical protein n=1 Tax=Micromonospora sp. NPDC049679 TaxID=3155920 RepID=UPI0033FA896F
MSTAAIDGTATTDSPRRAPTGWPGLVMTLRRHAAFGAVLTLAVGLRCLLYLAYRPALRYSDSGMYMRGAAMDRPLVDRPYGYSAFLKLLLPLQSVDVVTVLQHLMGLGLVVAGYAFLIRRGVRRWLAALAVTPVALDARQLVLEHFILAEALFTALLAAAILLLARRNPPGPLVAATAGLLVATAALTRSVGLPIAGLIVCYLLVRRVRWHSLAAFAVALVVPLGGYLVWYHSAHGVYAFGQYDGRFLFARTATFADCDVLELSDRLRELCPEQPVGQRPQRNDEYVWTDITIAHRKYRDVQHDPLLREFAVEAITQQPGDYAAMLLRETGWHFIPGLVEFDDGQRCLARAWQLPVRDADTCQTSIYVRDRLGGPAVNYAQIERLRPALKAYSQQGKIPGPLLLLGVLAALAAAVCRPGRPGWADGRDATLIAGVGLALVVISVATSMHDPRYVVPGLFFMGIGAALGVHRLTSVWGPPAEAAPVRLQVDPPTFRVPSPRRPADDNETADTPALRQPS